MRVSAKSKHCAGKIPAYGKERIPVFWKWKLF
jgi:hypothetical protein